MSSYGPKLSVFVPVPYRDRDSTVRLRLRYGTVTAVVRLRYGQKADFLTLNCSNSTVLSFNSTDGTSSLVFLPYIGANFIKE